MKQKERFRENFQNPPALVMGSFKCKGCELEGVSCDFYDEDAINCHWWRSKGEEK